MKFFRQLAPRIRRACRPTSSELAELLTFAGIEIEGIEATRR